MISKEEYDILVEVSKTGAPDRDLESYMSISTMCKEKLITTNIVGETRSSLLYHGFQILPLGKRAMEEYEAHIARDEREVKTLEIANEANTISKKSNKISSVSLVVSVASVLIALASFLVAVLV